MMSVRATYRGFSTTAKTLARTKFTIPKPPLPKRDNVRLPTQTTHHSSNLRITSPIPPTVSNLKCPPDHPLWQFFNNGKFLTAEEDLDSNSRSWSIPELRRKNFNDLHSLWYICLKQRNVLAREIHLLEVSMGADAGPYMDLSNIIRDTMWKIRHVLNERDLSQKKAQQSFVQINKEFVEQFEKDFLNDSQYDVSDSTTWETLNRFQFAIFGINEFIEDNKIDRDFVDGIKYISNLKLKKFNLDSSLGEIKDAGEAFVLFTAENNKEALDEAVQIVNELRSNGKSVSRYDELQTVANYIQQLTNATEEISTQNA